jgi:hypothetical protein
VERIEIPNLATYSPVALSDFFMLAPLASRVFLGLTVPGRMLQGAALGIYAVSAFGDWMARRGVRTVHFQDEFGADVESLTATPEDARWEEVTLLAERLSDEYVPPEASRQELAGRVNEELTRYLASVTGQEVRTSAEVRSFNLARVMFPFASGTCDMLTGDVAVFKDLGMFEAHVIAHEFTHRRGYWKELHAQVIAYLALITSDDPELRQSALGERLHRQMQTLAEDDNERYHAILDDVPVRSEVKDALEKLRPKRSAVQSVAGDFMKSLYDERMRLTGQNGLSDYYQGFTDFLHTYGSSETARQPRELALV